MTIPKLIDSHTIEAGGLEPNGAAPRTNLERKRVMKRIDIWLELALAATAASLCSCSATGGDEGGAVESADALALATYHFGALAGSSQCLDVAAAGSADGTNIQSWTCNGTSAQSFRVDSVGGSNYRLVNTTSGKCVDVAAAGTTDGTNVQLWTCNGSAAQSFRIEDLGAGKVRIVSAVSNKCLDVSGGSSAAGANVQLWSCNGGNAQVWSPQNALATTPAPSPSTCNYPSWHAGAAYVTGNIVNYTDGNFYVAEHDNPGYDPTVSTWFWDPYNCSGAPPNPTPTPTSNPTPTPTSGLGAILSEATFTAMFSGRNGFYSYSGLLNAAGTYGAFANSGDTAARKREVAAFLANTAHETGNLIYVEEIAKADYCSSSGPCPCAPGKRYYGRGPLQLSWNYNYCAAGDALGLDLRADPDLVARDATVAWRTGLWFWMTSSGAGYRPAHDSIVNGFGFGETIRTINGSLECGGGNASSVQSRVSKYLEFCQKLGVDPGSNQGC